MTRPGFLSNTRNIDPNFFSCFVLKCNDVALVRLNQGTRSIVFFVLFSYRPLYSSYSRDATSHTKI